MIANFMVCNSCKNSYNVLSHSHICQGCGGGGGVKKRESPDFRSPEVGISALRLKNSTTFKAYPEEFYRSSSWGKELGVGGKGCSMLNAKSKIQVTQSSVHRRSHHAIRERETRSLNCAIRPVFYTRRGKQKCNYPTQFISLGVRSDNETIAAYVFLAGHTEALDCINIFSFVAIYVPKKRFFSFCRH